MPQDVKAWDEWYVPVDVLKKVSEDSERTLILVERYEDESFRAVTTPEIKMVLTHYDIRVRTPDETYRTVGRMYKDPDSARIHPQLVVQHSADADNGLALVRKLWPESDLRILPA